MTFIQRLITLFQRDSWLISDALWLELLESGATAQEIQWYFGTPVGVEQRVQRLTAEERRHFAFHSAHLSSRMALWWVLKQRQEHVQFRTSVWQRFAYPGFLMGLALLMMVFLNHVMLPRLVHLFSVELEHRASTASFHGLFLLEVINLMMISSAMAFWLVPRRIRLSLLIRFYHHRILSDVRTVHNARFVTWIIFGLSQGLSVQTLIQMFSHSRDPIVSYWSKIIFDELKHGRSLSEAVERMDPHLRPLFTIQADSSTILERLQRHVSLMTLRVERILKRWRSIALGWGYLNMGIIIVSAYQMMYLPIRQLEQLV